ncbi:MAG: FkbM family methyltransferase [Flavobacteriia bacterium]
MKNRLKYILQKLMGFRTYLYVFALFKIRTLRSDAKEKDFFHFLSMLKDGDGAVLDVGANIGIMTVHLANKLPNSTIHAFEPIPENLSVLKKIVAKYNLKKIRIHETAVGESTGKVKMILPHDRKTKMQGLSHVKHESITEWNEGDEYNVPLDTLDNILNGEPIQGIKIDIENFEYYALKGGKRILESNHPLIYAELWENENRSKCFDLLSGLNYKAHVVEREKLVPYEPARHKHQNFIFISN